MAQYHSHISFSLLIGVVYAVVGVMLFHIYPEHAVLASVMVVIAGMLPNVDAGGGAPARELGGLLAAVSPIALIEFFPGVKAGGIARIALVVICCYFLTRMLIIRALQKFTVHRGMVHSIPAAVITGELVYLLFWDLYWHDRLFLAFGAFAGFLSHLFLDASTNVDLLGKVLGKSEKKPAALKLTGRTFGSTCAMYASMIVLGWFVARDFYPQLKFYGGVHYKTQAPRQ